MRRLLILSVVLTVLIGLGGPVTAKPGKPKPPAPPRLDVSIDANLWIWNVPGDKILFDLMVENSRSTAISDVAISLIIDGEEMFPDLDPVALDGGSHWSYSDPGFAYIVPEPSEPAGDANPVTATLTASFGDGAVLDSDSVTVDGPGDFWLGPCFEDAPVFEPDVPVEFDVDAGFCHHTFTPGYWTFTVEPLPRERLALTMRDHVAGNWCMLDEVIRGKPKLPLTIEVFIPGLYEHEFELPGTMEWRGPGVCLLGGRGICTDDDCYFPIGNPERFVLATPAGAMTATHHGATQP